MTFQPESGPSLSLGMKESQFGIGNGLVLVDEEIEENLCEVQFQNGLRPTEKLASGDFTVEMETGTGKTYVYLRTIFELNKNYGFTEFVIVVPSVTIYACSSFLFIATSSNRVTSFIVTSCSWKPRLSRPYQWSLVRRSHDLHP